MKKTVLSLVLVVAMLMSCVCTVGAAGLNIDSLTALLGYARPSLVPGDISLSADNSTYTDYLAIAKNTDFYAKATLDMSNVQRDVQRAHDELKETSDKNTLKEMSVTGVFDITVNIGAGISVPDAASTDTNMTGFNDAAKTLFEEVSPRTITGDSATGYAIAVTINVKSGVKVKDILNYNTNVSKLPGEISFTYGGLKAAADTIIGGTITGSVTIKNGIEDYATIGFTFFDKSAGADTSVAIQPATVDVPSSVGGGGGGSSKPQYTVKYETDGGTEYKDEAYQENKEIKIDKIPEKDGYVFDGWYLDAEFAEEAAETLKADKNITLYAKWLKERHPVPQKLNGDDHFAYVIGYLDGTVRPENNITRAEVTTIFFRLLKDEVRDANLTSENVFTDVNDGDWHNVAISTMAKLGVVNGRSENKFVPDAFITRAEFTAICARFDDAVVEYEGNLTDIEGHWAAEYIKRASAYGWIEGYSDNTFRPDQFITRAEAMTLINRVLNRIPHGVEDLLHDDMAKWSDNMDQSAWFYTAVQEATNSTEYDRPNSLYKTWTAVIENRDWSKYQK